MSGGCHHIVPANKPKHYVQKDHLTSKKHLIQHVPLHSIIVKAARLAVNFKFQQTRENQE